MLTPAPRDISSKSQEKQKIQKIFAQYTPIYFVYFLLARLNRKLQIKFVISISREKMYFIKLKLNLLSRDLFVRIVEQLYLKFCKYNIVWKVCTRFIVCSSDPHYNGTSFITLEILSGKLSLYLRHKFEHERV